MLKSVMKNCKDSDLIMKCKYLNEKLREENRISILGLADLCAVNESNKFFVRQILSENTSLVADISSSSSDLEEIFREYSKPEDGGLKGLVNKIKKYLKRSDIQDEANERNNSYVVHILSHAIRHELVRFRYFILQNLKFILILF